ncbi:aminopeptidase [Brevibacillus choshinensis]|uniref:Aminopeptidase n=1 Tax=Brevibacillus choshinensis TaxID=54911 RepID=A0ABR5NF08_BRECH|nr:aminopeptidase [Brevibacillus choshinensis]KQL49979.1 aminopeptidase [Brevibacillus choshinensis]
MLDQRLTKLAEHLLTYSLELQENENLMIELRGEGHPLVKELIKAAYAKGARPFVKYVDHGIQRELLKGTTTERSAILNKWQEPIWRDIQKVVTINGHINDSEMADVPVEKRRIHQAGIKPSYDYMVSNTRWTVISYPTPAMAQAANMPTDTFFDYYFHVCLLNYQQMHDAFVPLKQLMDETDKVRITGPGTDLSFSIKGISSIICAGKINVPDGEIYTSPVRDSVNGTITFNASTPYQGTKFSDIQLTFEKGKVVLAQSNDTKRINEIIDSDAGARYIGEFAISVNPYIQHPMNDIYFDEKIDGSFHFALGQAYKNADNGNRSTIHWDIVSIQRPEYGGGEIWFDDVLIRKDGLFVHEALLDLNPERLR